LSGDTYYVDPDLYDIAYADFVADIAPHVELVRDAGGPALEVCCGNGRLYVPVREAGIACDGLDLSEHMLASLRSKLAAKGLSGNVVHGDMRDFSLPRRYTLIVIPFNSFFLNLTQADQLKTLRCCRHHLEVGGRLVLTMFHPSAAKLIEWAGGKQWKQVPHGEGKVTIWDRCEDDRVEQVRHVTRRIEFSDARGEVTRREVLEFDLRYIYKPEMDLLLHVAGFSRWEPRALFAEYTDAASAAGDRPLREGDNIRWTAWKD